MTKQSLRRPANFPQGSELGRGGVTVGVRHRWNERILKSLQGLSETSSHKAYSLKDTWSLWGSCWGNLGFPCSHLSPTMLQTWRLAPWDRFQQTPAPHDQRACYLHWPFIPHLPRKPRQEGPLTAWQWADFLENPHSIDFFQKTSDKATLYPLVNTSL